MFRILCLENKKIEPDIFENFEETIQMIQWFIQDDAESITEPEYTYGVIDLEGRLLCIVKNRTYIDFNKFNFVV